jgi:multiple sugar transport system ATP-binding protein
MAAVELRNVRKAFGSNVVVNDLQLEIEDGRFTVLLGPSGCGKTTTLRMIAGLEDVTSGQILIGGQDVTGLDPRYRDVAMVFQNYALYSNLNVARNIGFPLRARKMPQNEIDVRVKQVAESLGLTDYLSRSPAQLSGGQQQRVAIGRAIIRQPKVFLFDEPLSNLDAKLRVEMRTELLRLQRSLGVTSIYVTHDQEEAMTLGDRVIVMNEGEIAQAGSPLEIYQRPKRVFVASFLGSPSMNLIIGRVNDGRFVHQGGSLTCEVKIREGEVTLGVRPEDLVVIRKPGGVRVELIETLGPRAIVTLNAEGLMLTAVIESWAVGDLYENEEVSVTVRESAAHLFDNSSGLRL